MCEGELQIVEAKGPGWYDAVAVQPEDRLAQLRRLGVAESYNPPVKTNSQGKHCMTVYSAASVAVYLGVPVPLVKGIHAQLGLRAYGRYRKSDVVRLMVQVAVCIAVAGKVASAMDQGEQIADTATRMAKEYSQLGVDCSTDGLVQLWHDWHHTKINTHTRQLLGLV
ncbi:MAG: hypothetical protein DRI61_09675 [Chloroflexi bacterium]|nr:MAG: hypothetical protein DRI61_09675 [Chloroflexota bacterium]